MKLLTKLIAITLLMTLYSCDISINSSEECLECSYRTDGITRTEKLCNDFGSDEDMDEMRDRMQMEADSLGVVLMCERS